VRGSPAFVLSNLLRHLYRIIRQTAGLGAWQVISPGGGTGRVAVVENLKTIQGHRFEQPTVIITPQVRGDEEIPAGVIAVLTPQTVDIVSHVAIRARNNRVLLATCYDPEMIRHLQALAGHRLRLASPPTNDLVFEEAERTESPPPLFRESAGAEPKKATRPSFIAYALLSKAFNEYVVGGKSINQTRLVGKLPEWIHLPRSVALPFGVFERVLEDSRNRAILEHYQGLLSRVEDQSEVLAELRKVILTLEAPPELIQSLHEVVGKAGLEWPQDWEKAWTSIKRVWA